MRDIVIGTAGHVDHGKTALITALTGFEGDTLAEEQRRGITIDLRFSHMNNEHTDISFIDVPGHDRWIKNMIAGAFGFDASMVVIDSSEGIKPQTHEHLEILNLLQVPYCIVALTKSDLVDRGFLEQRVAEVESYMEQFEHIELLSIVPTSIYQPDSIQTLSTALYSIPTRERRSHGLFRYYVDRSFSIAGAGAVVTGTILDGEVSVGDKLWVAQTSTEVRIKNIQVHDSDTPKAHISQRVAINLQNPKVAIKKGMLLTKKGFMRGFDTVDVWIESILGGRIKHDSRVIFYAGTIQIEAKVLLYEQEISIESGFARLVFDERVYLSFDEPFIISLSGRVGAGGRVLNPINDPIKKRVKLSLLKALHSRDIHRAFEILVSSHRKGFGLISSNQRFGLSHIEALGVASSMEDIVVDSSSMVLYPLSITQELEELVRYIYEKNPYALLSAKSLSLKLKWASETLLSMVLSTLESRGDILEQDGVYKNAHIEIDDIATLVETQIYNILLEEDITPDAPYNIYDRLDIDRRVGDNALKRLTQSRKVVRLSHNLFVSTISLDRVISELKDIISTEGYIDIALFKQNYNISRKYIVSYLEYLDRYSDISRDGNKRVLK